MKATSMAELMKKAAASNAIKTVHKGDVVSGVITKLAPSEILVDIGTKTEAVVLEKDRKNLRNILAVLKAGDRISVSVLNPESDMGHTVVSLRRFMDDLLWKKLENEQKNNTPISGIIAEVTRGGYLVDTSVGLSGFLPNSQILPAINTSLESPADIIGQKIAIYVLEVNRQAHKIIFSQKPVVSEEEFVKKTKQFTVGQKVTAIITTITSFGMFVTVPLKDGATVDGLIHISEIAWEKVDDIGSIFTVGQTVDVVVISIDREAKRLDLSIRRLSVDPFEELTKRYTKEQKVSGIATEIGATGVIVELEQNAIGFIRKEKIPPNVTYAVGDKITATISQFDKKRHRIELLPVLKEKPIGYR